MAKREKRTFRPVADPLILDLMTYLRLERNRSRLTVEAYARDLQEFGAFLSGAPPAQSPVGREYPGLGAATTSDVRGYVMHLAGDKRYDMRTVRRKLSSVKSLYRYLKLMGRREDDPASIVSGPKIERKLPEHLDQGDVRELLRTTLAGRSEPQRRRDVAILELLYACRFASRGNHHDRSEGPQSAGARDSDSRKRQQGTSRRLQPDRRRGDRGIPAVRPQSRDEALFLGRGGSVSRRCTCGASFATSTKSAESPSMPARTRCATPSPRTWPKTTLTSKRSASFGVHESLATTGIDLRMSMRHKKRADHEAHPRDRMKD